MDIRKARSLLLRAIEEFNRYRAPEARAALERLDTRGFQIRFSGCFCGTCGFYDYFEDFRAILSSQGLHLSISLVREMEDGAVVEYSLSG